MGQDGVDGLVEERQRQAVEVGGDGHDHVAAGEGLLRRQPPARGQQLAGQLVQVDGGRPVGGPGGVDRGVQGGGRVAQRGQLGLPADHQILRAAHRSLRSRVARAATDRAAYEPSGPTAASIWAERLEWASHTSAGIPAMAQPPSRPDGPPSASIP